MKSKNLWIFAGIFLLLLGIYLSVIQHEPHFYTPFSLGLFIISMLIYNKTTGKIAFKNWNISKIALFFSAVLVVSILIDRMGLFLGYWIYPYYNSILDEVLKYLFEWTIPLVAYMIIFMTGKNILSKLFFVLCAGIITEYVNSFTLSWQILKMPILDYTIGVFNMGFLTIGYWLIALIPYTIYQFVDRRVK